jgi:hypothetical protein
VMCAPPSRPKNVQNLFPQIAPLSGSWRRARQSDSLMQNRDPFPLTFVFLLSLSSNQVPLRRSPRTNRQGNP